MKIKRFISNMLSNWLIILGLAFLVIKVLDRYNPLMDFSGQSEILQIGLGSCAVILEIWCSKNHTVRLVLVTNSCVFACS